LMKRAVDAQQKVIENVTQERDDAKQAHAERAPRWGRVARQFLDEIFSLIFRIGKRCDIEKMRSSSCHTVTCHVPPIASHKQIAGHSPRACWRGSSRLHTLVSQGRIC
jgi:hypothetical protein